MKPNDVFTMKGCVGLLLLLLSIAAGCGGSPSRPTDQALPPSLSCPADLSLQSANGGDLAVQFPTPAVQNGTTPVSVSCTPPSGDSFSPGVSSVRCIAIDALSRSSTCAFSVTVTVPTPPRLAVNQFIAFGDSMTEGKISTSAIGPLVEFPGAYPSSLRTLLADRYTTQQFVVVNEGLGGETAADGKSRLPAALSADHPQVLLLLEGANDLTTGDPSKVPVAVSALQSMIQEARNRSIQVLVGTLPPQRPGAPNGRGAGLVVPVNDQIKPMASAQGATVVDLYAAFAGDVNALIGPDGLHPTPAGYDLIAHTFFDAIEKQFELVQAMRASHKKPLP